MTSTYLPINKKTCCTKPHITGSHDLSIVGQPHEGNLHHSPRQGVQLGQVFIPGARKAKCSSDHQEPRRNYFKREHQFYDMDEFTCPQCKPKFYAGTEVDRNSFQGPKGSSKCTLKHHQSAKYKKLGALEWDRRHFPMQHYREPIYPGHFSKKYHLEYYPRTNGKLGDHIFSGYPQYPSAI